MTASLLPVIAPFQCAVDSSSVKSCRVRSEGTDDARTRPAGGAALVAAFVAWELRAREPMLPMRFFRNRAFAAANGASLLMSFGVFGSIFLLVQFFQTAQGYSPLKAGLLLLPWTAIELIVAPIAGALSDRVRSRPLLAAGLALQAVGLAWMAAVSTVGYGPLVGPFILSGIGMAMFFAPVANVVLSAVRPEEKGKSSGANNAMREVGGVLGVAVLANGCRKECVERRVGGSSPPEGLFKVPAYKTFFS